MEYITRSGNYSADDNDWLELARYGIYVRLLPVIVSMAILGAVGIVGNILTIIFYSLKTKRSPSRIQITLLAVVDLMVCVLKNSTILEMVTNVAHNLNILCKIAHFLGHWMIAVSSLILWVVAVERYRKICRPFGNQMTIKSTYFAIIGCAVFALFLSVREFFHFELIPLNVTLSGYNRTVSGKICTTTSNPDYKISLLIFYGFDTFLIFTCWITIVVTYSKIALTLFRLNVKKRRGNSQKNSNASQSQQVDLDTITQCPNMDTSEISDIGTAESHKELKPVQNACKGSIRWTDTLKRRLESKRQMRNPAESATERTITLMMLTVSVGFVVCILPYFVVKVSRLVLKLDADYELDTGIQFALRLVYVNSVFNPIVYCCFNPRFRQFFFNILLQCCRGRKDKPKLHA